MKNVHNALNLACDLMEPFRPFVDHMVLGMQKKVKMIQRAFYEKYLLLLLGSCQGEGIVGEMIRMIDSDLCEIS